MFNRKDFSEKYYKNWKPKYDVFKLNRDEITDEFLVEFYKEQVYCATKWGERGYTKSLKVAYKGTSVKVVGVYPGGINTDFYKKSTI